MCKGQECNCPEKDPRYPDEVCVEFPHPSPKEVREYRLSMGLSRWEAALRFGGSLTQWRQWESETDKPRVGFIGFIKSLFSRPSKATA